MKKIICLLLAIILIFQPIGYRISKTLASEPIAQIYVNKFVPEDGKTLLFIGQDDDEVADYISAVKEHEPSENTVTATPAGMMIYTNLSD